MKSYILGLQCPRCARGNFNTDMTRDPICPIHGEFQEARYDIDAIKHDVDREHIPSEPKSIWRWSALLPIRDPASVVTLFERDTPLFHAR